MASGSYLIFGFLAALGTLQILAIRHGLKGFSLWDVERISGGYLLGGAIFLGGMVWFFLDHWEAIFAPGPAGGELVPLLVVDVALAAAALLAGATLTQPLWRRWRRRAPGSGAGEAVAFGQMEGRLYLPQEGEALLPAVCLLANPWGDAGGGLEGLGEALARRGLAVLAIRPQEAEKLGVGEALALFPQGIACLSQHPMVDARRIALVGWDLGADLAIRALAQEEGIAAAVALAPRLGVEALGRGLPLLREFALPGALRWSLGGRERKLTERLGAKASLEKPKGDRLLIIRGQRDGLVTMGLKASPAANPPPQVVTIPGQGHLSIAENREAARLVADWLGERLGQPEEAGWKAGT